MSRNSVKIITFLTVLMKMIKEHCRGNDFVDFSWFGNLSGQAPCGPDGFGKHAKSIKSLFFRALALVCSLTMSRNILKIINFMTCSMTHKPKHCKNNNCFHVFHAND